MMANIPSQHFHFVIFIEIRWRTRTNYSNWYFNFLAPCSPSNNTTADPHYLCRRRQLLVLFYPRNSRIVPSFIIPSTFVVSIGYDNIPPSASATQSNHPLPTLIISNLHSLVLSAAPCFDLLIAITVYSQKWRQMFTEHFNRQPLVQK